MKNTTTTAVAATAVAKLPNFYYKNDRWVHIH